MDSVQKQIITLSHKVDSLHQLIEQLTERVTEALSKSKSMPVEGSDFPALASNGYYSYQSYSRGSVMDHKDVLTDSNCLEKATHSREKDLSPEVQIQRLTAQLTAAYNRIAALEEQLLAQRVHY